MDFINYQNYRLNNFSKNLTGLISKEKTLNYSELENQINSYASYLKENGIKKDDRVCLIGDNSIEFIFIVLALWKLNAVPVPLNTKLQDKELKGLIDFSKCQFVFIHKDLKRKISFSNSKTIYFPFDNLSFNQTLKEISNSESLLNNTAVIIFTSGSTGKPKGVMLSFKNLIVNAVNGNEAINYELNDKWLASLPFYHIGGFSIIVRALLFGNSIVIPNSLKNDDIIFCLENFNPTLVSFVSTQMQRLIDISFKPNKNIKNVLLGGGFINETLCRSALKNGWPVSRVYGSSETSSFVAYIDKTKLPAKINSSGKALTKNQILILDGEDKKLKPNQTGEIVVKSDSVMEGYLFNLLETKAKLKDDFYYTGDVGYLDEEGYLFVEARRSDLIITGGENVNPLEVEKHLNNIDEIKESCVFPIEDTEWGQKIAAAVVLNKKISEEKIKEILKNKIASYKIPKIFFFVDNLPKTSLDKIKRQEIKEKYSN